MTASRAESKAFDRLARRYHEEAITPFSSEVNFRLPRDVRARLRGWRLDSSLAEKVVIDFGCGIGDSLELVAGRVGLAAGLDFSPGMLRETRRRLETRGLVVERLERPAQLARRLGDFSGERRTVLVKGNMLRLGTLRGAADLAIAVNSINPGTRGEAYRMFAEVASCIRRGGGLMAVFPALDAFFHLRKLMAGEPEAKRAWIRVDPVTGVYTQGKGDQLKCFTDAEIASLCAKHGLVPRRLEKIRYPWTMMRRFGWGYFPRAPRLWDWYLDATRR